MQGAGTAFVNPTVRSVSVYPPGRGECTFFVLSLVLRGKILDIFTPQNETSWWFLHIFSTFFMVDFLEAVSDWNIFVVFSFQYFENSDLKCLSCFQSGKLVQRLFDRIEEVLSASNVLVVLLLDEVESLATQRRAVEGEPTDATRAVNALLTQIDALKKWVCSLCFISFPSR